MKLRPDEVGELERITLKVTMVCLIPPLLLVALFALIAWFTLSSPAHGHDWYDRDCCDTRDCHPIDAARVQIVQDGYLLDGKWLYTWGENGLRPSQDGGYSTCDPYPDVKPRCLYVPRPGS